MSNTGLWTDTYGGIDENYRGDFIGFTWDGMSLSRLGVLRASDGSRFTEDLSPAIQSKTSQVPGNDGTYYFDTYHTQRPFNLSLAFDRLTEKGLRQLKQLFETKNIHRLSFDETPYKEYYVKVNNAPQLKYIPFDGVDNKRVYKGEMQLSLVAYKPYAKSRAASINELKTLDEDVYMANRSQWKDASGILDSMSNYNKLTYYHEGIDVYNPGDIPADFMLYISNFQKGKTYTLSLYTNPESGTPTFTGKKLRITIADQPKEVVMRINTKAQLLEGAKEIESGKKYEPTNSVFNNLVAAGEFFKIPTGYFRICIDEPADKENVYKNLHTKLIEYDYWYL